VTSRWHGVFLKELYMVDIVSKLKTAAIVAGAALIVAACGQKPAETNVEVTTETAPAEVAAPVEEAAPAMAEGDAMAPAEGEAAAPAADAAAAPAAPEAAPAQ
jgi:hypothetical protein